MCVFLVLFSCVRFGFSCAESVRGEWGFFMCRREREWFEWGKSNSIFQLSKFLEEIAKTLGKQQILDFPFI